MNSLLNFGKSMLNKKGDGGGDNSNNSSSIFGKFDRDGDGSITENDFVLAVRDMGLGSIGESTIRSLFKKIDKNQNGKLDFSEAFGLVSVIKEMISKKKSDPSIE